MSRLWLALGIWFLFLVAGIILAIWLHDMEHPNPGLEPGLIATIKEKVLELCKKLKGKIKRRKKE